MYHTKPRWWRFWVVFEYAVVCKWREDLKALLHNNKRSRDFTTMYSFVCLPEKKKNSDPGG